MVMTKEYIQNIQKLFHYYKDLGDKTIAQLEEEEIHVKFSDNENSIWIIVKHMAGNMKSRWTDFYTSDGEKSWRNRDEEFTDNLVTKADLIRVWNEGWAVLLNVIDNLTDKDISKTITIRSEPHSVLEAINRQFGHYSYHVGQIVFLGKLIRKDSWQSLSIPKGKSDAFNASMNHLQK
jgi:hypothetical protein